MAEVEIDVEVIHSTEGALLVDNGNGKEVWVPRSCITDYCEEKDGTITSIFMTERMASKKGLV